MSDSTSAPAHAVGIVTADDLLAMGKGRRELIFGSVIEMTLAGHEHGIVEMNIAGPLFTFVRKHELGDVFPGDTGFLLATDPDLVRCPDVAFVRLARRVVTPKYYPGAPDIAVEIVSPNDSYTGVQEKLDMWRQYGAREVWVVDPQSRTVRVVGRGAEFVLRDGESLDGGDELAGFQLALEKIFPPREPR